MKPNRLEFVPDGAGERKRTERQTPTAPRAGTVVRYAVSLALLVAIIGGIAWVAQNLPRTTPARTVKPVPRDKELVRFAIDRAVWDKFDPNSFREFEIGEGGYYDFLFKNYLGDDVELLHFSTTCDCTSMDACVLPLEEVERLGKIQAENPGAPLPYQPEPSWQVLPKDPLKAIHLKVKANEGGAVRVRWSAKKSAGSELRVNPSIHVQADGDPSSKREFKLMVPAMMTYPVRFFPPRFNVGVLIPGSVVKAEFDAWSPTRDKFELALAQSAADPFFVIETTPLSPKQCAGLERNLVANKVPTHVKSGYHVTISVHESKAGQQLDLGAFYRKFTLILDGSPMLELPSPEVVGRVQGDLVIGGADDQGKILFKSFDVASGKSQTVKLLAAADIKLKPVDHHPHQPTWLKIRLTSDEKVIDGNKRIWNLEVTVPPKTPVARSFDEPDAVVLQIVGDPPRYVRIPLEGHASGR